VPASLTLSETRALPRLRRYRISERLLADVFEGGHTIRSSGMIEGLPRDAQVKSARYDRQGGYVDFVYESPEFAAVACEEYAPLIEVLFNAADKR
jgi:hypothetical protein